MKVITIRDQLLKRTTHILLLLIAAMLFAGCVEVRDNRNLITEEEVLAAFGLAYPGIDFEIIDVRDTYSDSFFALSITRTHNTIFTLRCRDTGIEFETRGGVDNQYKWHFGRG